MMLGKLDSHIQKNETKITILHHTQVKSKWIKDLNLRPETIELLKENTGGKLLDIGLGDDFLIGL